MPPVIGGVGLVTGGAVGLGVGTGVGAGVGAGAGVWVGVGVRAGVGDGAMVANAAGDVRGVVAGPVPVGAADEWAVGDGLTAATGLPGGVEPDGAEVPWPDMRLPTRTAAANAKATIITTTSRSSTRMIRA